jgi:hypothetical protein
VLEQFLDGQADVLRDLAQEDRREIATCVERYSRRAAIDVAKLLVRAALAHLDEAQRGENGNDLAGFEDRDTRHSGDDDGLRAHKLRLELGLAIVQEHGDHLLEIGIEFVERFGLAVRAWEPGHITHIELRVGATFDYRGIGMHSEACWIANEAILAAKKVLGRVQGR